MHDAKVDRTTDGTGSVYGMSLDQVQALDAGHDFVPGVGTRTGLPEESYPFRGVRTGAKAPPFGYEAQDFRIPTLDQVMRTLPGGADQHRDQGPRRQPLRLFRRATPTCSPSSSTASGGPRASSSPPSTAPRSSASTRRRRKSRWRRRSARSPRSRSRTRRSPTGMVAFQIPITFEGIPVTDADLVQRAHAQDYGVHVWLSNDGENEEIYDRLLGFGVDGIMAAEPGRLEGVLCAAGVPRPARPADWPGRAHCSPRNSIACEARVVGLELRSARAITATLRRTDDFAGSCAGKVRVRRPGAGVIAQGPVRLRQAAACAGRPAGARVHAEAGRQRAAPSRDACARSPSRSRGSPTARVCHLTSTAIPDTVLFDGTVAHDPVHHRPD